MTVILRKTITTALANAFQMALALFQKWVVANDVQRENVPSGRWDQPQGIKIKPLASALKAGFDPILGSDLRFFSKNASFRQQRQFLPLMPKTMKSR